MSAGILLLRPGLLLWALRIQRWHSLSDTDIRLLQGWRAGQTGTQIPSYPLCVSVMSFCLSVLCFSHLQNVLV